MKLFKNSKRGRRIAVALGVAFVGLVGFSATDDYFEISKNLEVFTGLYKELNVYYVDETKPGELMKTGIDAMLKSLDPYTVYYPESKMEDYRFMTTGEYGGIGALVNTIDGDITIMEPYEGFAAHKAGIIAGDIVEAVDGKDVTGKSHDEISKFLKGQAGTEVVLSIYRPVNKERMDITFEREEVKIPDIPYHGMVDETTGYINLRSFTKTASKEIRTAYNELKDKEGMTRLILDLRENRGGLLREAVNIVNFFVPKGQEVVSTKGKLEEWNKTYSALNEPLSLDMPVIVLTNRNSASASEIVSGTLQDLDRAVVLGQRTFGKGLVQQTKDLDYNTKLKLTVAKYYTPSGRCIQKLDYSNKDQSGKVNEVADSLIKPFYTVNGREVFDGRGVQPDVEVELEEMSNVLGGLAGNYLIFNFANQYFQINKEIAEPENFRLTDKDFEEFVAYALNTDFDYNTATEKMYDQLKEAAEKERYLEGAENEFDSLFERIKPNKENDIRKFKDQIVKALEEEIITKYYYQEGRIRYQLALDEHIERSLQVFESEYETILAPK